MINLPNVLLQDPDEILQHMPQGVTQLNALHECNRLTERSHIRISFSYEVSLFVRIIKSLFSLQIRDYQYNI